MRGVLARLYDLLYSEQHRLALEHAIVALSAAGFLAHLLHIFLARTMANPPRLIALAGTNYFSAIYTPFSFILFYEVLVLIWAIPRSTTESMALQYEIVSLIFIRGFFKSIAGLEIDRIGLPLKELRPALLDVGAGLLMFFLVTIFQRTMRGRPVMRDESVELKRFIARKKIISLVLTVVFVSMAAAAVWKFAQDALRGTTVLEGKPAFYTEMFTVMVFTDVLILILSLMVSDRYELVFRNAAFVVSTIMMRFALTAGSPYGAITGVSGMLFGIATLAIYNYNTRLTGKPP